MELHNTFFELLNSEVSLNKCVDIFYVKISLFGIIMEEDKLLLGATRNEEGFFEWLDGSLIRDGYVHISNLFNDNNTNYVPIFPLLSPDSSRRKYKKKVPEGASW